MAVLSWRRLNRRRDHRWAGPLHSSYIDGELAPRQHRRLAEHEELCPECRRMIRKLKAVIGVLRAIRQSGPALPSIADSTVHGVRERITAGK